MGKFTDWLLGPEPLTAAGYTAGGSVIDGLASPDEWTERDTFARITLEHLWGNIDSIPVTRDTALGVAAVDRAMQLITGQISTFPLVHFTGSTRTTVQPQLIVQPEAGRAASQTWLWIADSLFFYGRAWLLVTERYAEDGRPKRVRFAAEWNVRTDMAGNVVEAFGNRVDKPSDVIRIDGPHNGILNRPRRIREAIAVDVAAGNASQNPVPSIDLHQVAGDPMTDDQIDSMILRWVNARRQGGTGGVSFTNQSIEAKPLGIQPEQLLIAGRNQAALNVARMANLPAWAVDASTEGSSLTYSNVPSRSRELIDYTFSPYLTAIVSRLSMNDVLPAGQWVRFDTSGLLRGDFQTRATTYKLLIDSGIYTAQECRSMEDGTFIA